MKVKVERLKLSDWDSFYDCFKELLGDFKLYPPKAIKFYTKEERLKNAFLKKKRVFWVVKKENKVVGFLISIEKDEQTVFINWMGVRKDFRGQGVGKELVLFWENWARKENYKKLRASTSIKENIPFYEKLGFSFEEIKEKSYYGLDRYVMGKKI